jgi:hypothetical protein
MARFSREAQVLASMNHPNIEAIYGVEELAFIMELIETETLQLPASRGDGAELRPADRRGAGICV